MNCPRCGLNNNDEVTYCGSCGANIKELLGSWPASARALLPGEKMTFVRAISRAFMKYADFHGRASRAEYWWFILFLTLVYSAIMVASIYLDPNFFNPTEQPPKFGFTKIAIIVFVLAVALPRLAIDVRRLHDKNHSGWWILLSCTIIGSFPVLYWLVKKGDSQPNRFGHATSSHPS